MDRTNRARDVARLVAVTVALSGCGGDGGDDPGGSSLELDPRSCEVCGMQGPLPPVEGAAVPERLFLGVGNPYWFWRTEVTLTREGRVHIDTLSESRGDDSDDGRVSPTFATAVLEATLPALVDAAGRPEVEPIPDAPAYQFEVQPDDLALGTVWHTEGEVDAAPPLCCVAEALELISQRFAGHPL